MTLTLNLQSQRAAGALVLNLAPPGTARTMMVAGRTVTRGAARLGVILRMAIAGRTAPCRGHAVAAYDPNLLSALHAVSGTSWRDGDTLPVGPASRWKSAAGTMSQSTPFLWSAALLAAQTTSARWKDATPLAGDGGMAWMTATRRGADTQSAWKEADRQEGGVRTVWREAAALVHSSVSGFAPNLPRLDGERVLRWTDGHRLPATVVSPVGDGAFRATDWRAVWGDAGLAYNAWQPPWVPPPRPKPPGKPIVLNLKNVRPAGPLVLNLGPTRPDWDIADRRYYSVLNACSVVRLPERTELPVTAVTVETDVESWGWSVSLTLVGESGWTLCQPSESGLPREVEITINGTVWTALLDDPQLAHTFNDRKITAKGMSRSGWLAAPFAPSSTVSYDVPRTAQQIAEEILDGTGWALDWQLPADPAWLIPAGGYLATGTPLERLLALIAPLKGSLYSDPAGYQLTAYPRYPVLPWQWETAAVDVALPEAALLSWNQSSQDKPALNRVYVSGTTSGVLLQLTRAGTAGDLQPATPIVDALLTDASAARARAEYELAQAGPGFEVQVETLLGGNEAIPLIRPGLLCSFAGLRGIVRSCRITASRQTTGLAVWQALKLERRLN